MTSPAEVLYNLLLQEALITDQAATPWKGYIGFLPDIPEAPDEAVCVYDTAGKLDGRLMATGEVIEHPGIQVRVRGRRYAEAWDRMNSIVEALDAVVKISVAVSGDGTYTLHSVSRSGAVIPLGVEEQENHRHHHFTANMTLSLSRD